MVEIQFNINDVINKLVDIAIPHIPIEIREIGRHTQESYNIKYLPRHRRSLHYKIKYLSNINEIKEEFCTEIFISNEINTFDGLYEVIFRLKTQIFIENIGVVLEKSYIEILDYELMEEKCN